MTIDNFIDNLLEKGEYECSCHINPPCTFCTDTVSELYEDWCKENNIEPIY